MKAKEKSGHEEKKRQRHLAENTIGVLPEFSLGRRHQKECGQKPYSRMKKAPAR
jgi:hypothetical protein